MVAKQHNKLDSYIRKTHFAPPAFDVHNTPISCSNIQGAAIAFDFATINDGIAVGNRGLRKGKIFIFCSLSVCQGNESCQGNDKLEKMILHDGNDDSVSMLYVGQCKL